MATLKIDGRDVTLENEKNLLEVARKAGIEIPTFCYHSRLSVYGACRLCLVDIEGRGIVTSCSVAPEAGMVVRTQTAEIRSMRKIAIELLLANHHQSCPSCDKSATCKLLSLARRLGVTKTRFRGVQTERPLDYSSKAIVRDPNKCILCGDCVRMCGEVQQVGALDFTGRGHDVTVAPAFGKGLGEVDCVSCGQCAAVCPTGALTVASHLEDVWRALDDPTNKVVVQIAPAVRVALGECFGLPAGGLSMGQAVTALRRLGFAKVYDTAFAADLTVIEEATEFLARKTKGEKLPQFTSCCPAWVTYVERHHPDFVPHLSSCRSPQQMFGSLARRLLPEELGIERAQLVVVSIMPCAAKKVEADLDKFKPEGRADVDFVITTKELARMIERAGLRFADLEPGSPDLPMGFKTGAGVIFGASGGVTEAVLRYAGEKLCGHSQGTLEFAELRGEEDIRLATLQIGDTELKLAVAQGLGSAKKLLTRIKAGELDLDLVEVMACPGGCVGGAGQPESESVDIVRKRARGLYDTDRTLELHKSQENHLIQNLYRETLGAPGGETAHHLLHTHYAPKRRHSSEAFLLSAANGDDCLRVEVCVGTNCHLKGSQELLRKLLTYVHANDLDDQVEVAATFCFESCDRGPTVRIGEETLTRCTYEQAVTAMTARLTLQKAAQATDTKDSSTLLME